MGKKAKREDYFKFSNEKILGNIETIREAMLNAVAHRDYTINSQSIFIKASPEAFEIESPGGFLPGITPDNVLYKKNGETDV